MNVRVERRRKHGWRASCSCGWVGPWERRESWAQSAVVWHEGGHRMAHAGRRAS